jgi:conjugative transfer signal peptidase TraF
MARLWTRKFLSQDKSEPERPLKWPRIQANRSDTRVRSDQSVLTRGWPLAVALAVAGGATVAARAGFGLNLSGSAPRGLYRLVAGASTRDALVVACLPADVGAFGLARGYLGAGTCPGGAQPVLKRVIAVAGDVIDLDDAGTAVNGRRVIHRPLGDRDREGRPVHAVPVGRHLVPPGNVWLAGDAGARSWDSRSFGAVPVAGVLGLARPLVTIDEAGR